MSDPLAILRDPNYVNANPTTKKAIFDRRVATLPEYRNADAATQRQIQQRFNIPPPARAKLKKPEDGGFMERLGRTAGVVTNALAPYSTAAAAGAAAGAPFAGVGAIPGAAGGVLSLGLADIGTTAYNAVAPVFGGRRASLPSETIRQGYRRAGIGKEPVTTGERLLSAGIEGAAGAVSGSGAANQFANIVRGPTTRKVLTALAQQPKAQAAAGAGSAIAGQGAAEMGFGPKAQLAASFAGGAAGGYAGATRPKVVTPQAITAKAQAAYKTADDAGVMFNPNSLQKLASDIRQALSSDPDVQFHPTLHPRISVALKELDDLSANFANTDSGVSFSRLEMARRVANEARKSLDPSERRLGHLVIEKIDDFVQNPPGNFPVIQGNQTTAAAAIKEARTAWRQTRQSEVLDTAVEKATNAEGGLTSTNLRAQIRQIVNNPKRLRQFDPDTQKALKNFIGNKNMVAALQTLGKISPSFNTNFNLKNLMYAASGAGAYTAGNTTVPIVAGLTALVGTGAKSGANSLAKNRVTNMANKLRGTPDFKLPAAGIGMATATQSGLGQGFPLIDPETGAPLVEVTEFDGYLVPVYGRPRR